MVGGQRYFSFIFAFRRNSLGKQRYTYRWSSRCKRQEKNSLSGFWDSPLWKAEERRRLGRRRPESVAHKSFVVGLRNRRVRRVKVGLCCIASMTIGTCIWPGKAAATAPHIMKRAGCYGWNFFNNLRSEKSLVLLLAATPSPFVRLVVAINNSPAKDYRTLFRARFVHTKFGHLDNNQIPLICCLVADSSSCTSTRSTPTTSGSMASTAAWPWLPPGCSYR